MKHFVRFRVCASNAAKCIDAITKANIELFDGRFLEDGYHFKVSKKHSQKLIALLEQMCYNDYNVLSESGLLYRLRSLKKRKGIIAGILIVAIVFGILNTRLNSIRVFGLSLIAPHEVEQVLDEQGIRRGVSTRRINRTNLEYVLTNSLEKAALVSVTVRGMTLIVNIFEELPDPSLPDEEVPVFAAKDGIITRVIVFQGSAAVNVGDSVRQGDLLIAPFMNVGGAILGVRAAGEVWARVFYGGRATFSDSLRETQRTGITHTANSLELFGARIGGQPVSPFVLYEEEIVVQYLFGPVPVRLTRHTFFELSSTIVTRTFKEAKPALVESARQRAMQGIAAGLTIIDEWYLVIEGVSSIWIEYYIEVEERIG